MVSDRIHFWRFFIVIAVMASNLCVLPLNSYAATKKSTNTAQVKDLKAIQNSITQLNNNIHLKQNNEQQLQSSLAQTETAITQINQQLKPVTEELTQQQNKLVWLQTEHERHQTQLQIQQNALSKLLYTAYVTHEFDPNTEILKILLNQKSISKMSRYLEYYRVLNNERANQIDQFHDTLSQLEKNQLSVSKQTTTLQTNQKRFQQEDEKLHSALNERQSLLQKIRLEIRTDQARLEQLKKDAEKLEQTLRELAQRQQQNNSQYVNAKAPPFKQYRGKLVWPTQGKIVHQFGSQIENSELSWKGVLINAPSQQNIRAVAPGKVIFAEWLRGYGLLMIIDHGQNYMTLYGRNHVLYRKTGDIVSAGDIISQVGQSGGYDEPGLYFEVRFKGQPIDPQRWLST